MSGWAVAAKTYAAHPILGSGPETFMQEYTERRSAAEADGMGWQSGHACAHNIILQVAATMGLIGLLSLAFLAFFVVREAEDDLRPALAAYAVGALFSPLMVTGSVLIAVLKGHQEAKDGPPCVPARFYAPVAVLLAITLSAWSVAEFHAYTMSGGQMLTKVLRAGQSAVNWAPWDSELKADYLLVMTKAHDALKDGKARAAVLLEMRRQAYVMVRLHPGNWGGHYSLSIAMYYSAISGAVKQKDLAMKVAKRSIAEAARLNPHHPGIAVMVGKVGK